MDLKEMLIVIASLCRAFAIEDDLSVPVGGVEGKSVRLRCDLPISSPPRVRWVDFVYNTVFAEPSVIFTSQDNDAAFDVQPGHDNSANFVVGPDHSLTISNLQIDQDPGKYICESVVDGTLHRRSYYLTVGAKPQCSGDVELREGSQTTLVCHAAYSGQQPTLEWIRGLQDVVDSEEGFELRLAKRSLTLASASYRDDNTMYTCRMKMGDVIQECRLTIRVKHLVRDIGFTPEGDTFRVGQELTCSATGNPTPTISLLPLSSKGRSGESRRSIVFEPEWQDSLVTVSCLASNSLDGKTEILAKNVTISVIEELKDKEAVDAVQSFTFALVIGICVTIVILACVIVIVIIVVMKRKNPRPPKGSKPLNSKEELSQDQYGEAV